MASFHPAIGNVSINVKEDLLRLNSGGLVLTVISGKVFTVGICQGNHLIYFEDRPVKYAVDTVGDAHFFHKNSNSLSLLLVPVHAFGIIARANDAFQFYVDSVYEESGALML